MFSCRNCALQWKVVQDSGERNGESIEWVAT